MSSVRLCGVGFRYADAVDLFQNVDLHLTAGWTGVVGPNGAGKTTLLRLISGELVPTDGRVESCPQDAVVIHCRQTVDIDDAVVELASAWDKSSVRWRRRLAVEADDIERWDTLSPGERKRWQLAAALSRAPDVLLLDEPTNHLDTKARTMVERALASYRGIGCLVSHDRALLDALTAATVRVAEGTAQRVGVSYGVAAEQWRVERETSVEDAARRSRRAQRARHQLAVARQARAGAEQSIRSRPKSPHDSDGRSANRKARAAKAEAVHAKRLGAMKTRVSRADQERAAVTFEKQHGGELVFRFEPAPKAILAAIDAPICAGDRVLVARASYTVRRTSRVHVIGDNGSGKTTLLAQLTRAARVPSKRLLVLPQELSESERLRALEQARALGEAERGRMMQLMALLGVDPGRLLASALPSPGEARKLVIAKGLSQQAWLMILDEPTNHLDLPSVERLERALSAFPGAIVLTSHDRAFAASLCDETWTLDGACSSPFATPDTPRS